MLVNLVGGNVPTRLLEEAALCEGESVGDRGVERVVGGGRGRMRVRCGIRKRRNRRRRRVELGGERERSGGLQLLGRGELDGELDGFINAYLKAEATGNWAEK